MGVCRQGAALAGLEIHHMGTPLACVAKHRTALQREGLPLIKSSPVPLENLASLLVTPDCHLITLIDEFVGFVLPSKVYGCVASRRPILYIGSTKSDVHLLCSEQKGVLYEQIEVGNVIACTAALERLADHIERQAKHPLANIPS